MQGGNNPLRGGNPPKNMPRKRKYNMAVDVDFRIKGFHTRFTNWDLGIYYVK